MSYRWYLVSVVVLCLVTGCGDSDDDPADAMSPTPPDAAADASTDAASADAAPGADAGACDLDRTVVCLGGAIAPQACDQGPIELGSLCDDLFACVAGEAEASALRAVAPDFTCEPGGGGVGMCGADQYVCYWISPGIIDQAKLDQICAVTVLPAPPDQVQCFVYL